MNSPILLESLPSQYLVESSPYHWDMSLSQEPFCSEENVLECAVYLIQVVHY